MERLNKITKQTYYGNATKKGEGPVALLMIDRSLDLISPFSESKEYIGTLDSFFEIDCEQIDLGGKIGTDS